jgi:hypothetical protein
MAIEEIRVSGIVSARGIARELTARRVPTPTGSSTWAPAQVQRLLRAAHGRNLPSGIGSCASAGLGLIRRVLTT